jgi:hypothetical protein
VRWERPAAMQLWQLDIVGGVQLVDPATGVLREAKLVTAVDDHSRFCVIAKVVEPSGNMIVCQRQFWMGTHRAGLVARIWADCDLIHVLIAGVRIKTVRSPLSVTQLAPLVAQGAVAAGPSPLPPIEDGDAVEVERTVNRSGSVSLGRHIVLAAEILGGRRIGVRIEPTTLMFYDLDTRELLRTRANPLTPEQV